MDAWLSETGRHIIAVDEWNSKHRHWPKVSDKCLMCIGFLIFVFVRLLYFYVAQLI